MTDYSKLSDTEIAERVCCKLGAPAGEDYYTNLLWATQQIPVHEDSFDFYRDYEDIDGTRKRLFAFLCFDWPAPIMMQKVEEDIMRRRDKNGAHLELIVHHENRNNTVSVRIWGADLLADYCFVPNHHKCRALYEAYLTTLEKINDHDSH